MKKEIQNKCEIAGFEHSWHDTTPNIIYATNPPQYPPRQETCRNCKLTRTFHEKREEWIEYSDGKERPNYPAGTITICSDNGLSGGIINSENISPL